MALLPLRLQIPLFAKILGWLLLNLILALCVLFAFAAHGQSGLNVLLTQTARDRVTSIARRVGESLYDVSDMERAQALLRASQQYGARFSAKDEPQRPRPPGNSPPDARAGPPPEPPNGDFGPPPPPPGAGPGSGRGARDVLIEVHSATRGGYDVTTQLEVARYGRRPRPIELVAHAASLPELLRFLGIERDLLLVSAVLALSALFWWPFVWHITAAIQRLLAVTQQMARGELSARVPVERRDELGQLAIAVNTMGEHLQAYVQGQRQFMADVAHEVISPVSRIQIGLGILESRVSGPSLATVNDIREDLDEMSGMLNELLLFARSGVELDRTPAGQFDLRQLVGAVVTTEPGSVAVKVNVPADLQVKGHPAMLRRALSNLVRNAQRYGQGSDSPIEISARANAPYVYLTVRDRGPGVPEAALARLGEPFFRPESARSRATGGFGLGLAIVRRCVAACEGEVYFRNREGGGFEAEIALLLKT